MRFGRAAANFEPEIEPVEPEPTNGKERWHLKFWVKRPQENGGNLTGDCSGYELHRSGALTIFMDGGKRYICAPGTWTDCTTETKR